MCGRRLLASGSEYFTQKIDDIPLVRNSSGAGLPACAIFFGCKILLHRELTNYMKQNNRQTGNKGETAACELLQREGYTIIQRNYGNKWGEVDIVCKITNHKFSNSQMGEEYRVFVEVKTKKGGEYGEPWEMINSHKLHQVQNMAHLWCEEYGWKGLCRVDVVGVWMSIDGDVERIEHWENVQM